MKYFRIKLLVCFFLIFLIGLGVIFSKSSNQKKSDTTQKDLIFFDTTNYYYEPKENFDQTDQRDWLSDKPLYHFNNDSFKDRFDYPVNKQLGVYRIIALGDSNTEGKFINTDKSFPEQLEDLLNTQICQQISKFEVINLGVSGYDIQYSLERFKKRGAKYEPDLVLWYISGPSFHKILEKIYPKTIQYRKEMELSGELKQQEKKGDFYPFETKAQKEFNTTYSTEQRDNYQKAVLKRFIEVYQGKLIFLTVGKLDPTKFPPEIALNLDQDYKNILKDFTKSNSQVYFHDDLPTLEDSNQRLLDLHPNAEGYRLFAESIFNYLKAHDFISCK